MIDYLVVLWYNFMQICHFNFNYIQQLIFVKIINP